jgi:hypothetical protein
MTVSLPRIRYALAFIDTFCAQPALECAKVMTALFGPINAVERATALREAGTSGVFTAPIEGEPPARIVDAPRD